MALFGVESTSLAIPDYGCIEYRDDSGVPRFISVARKNLIPGCKLYITQENGVLDHVGNFDCWVEAGTAARQLWTEAEAFDKAIQEALEAIEDIVAT